MKKINIFVIAAALVLLLSLGVKALPITVDRVEINDVQINSNDAVKLSLDRGQNLEVEVKLTALDNLSNVEVEAFISGYEYSDFEPLSETSHVFDATTGTSYIKKLKFDLPVNVETDNYKLRIIVSDRNGQADVYNYNLKIDAERHLVEIKDVILSPQYEVQSGRALLTTVRIKNMGEKVEEGIKVKADIPALGISAADYVDKLKVGESTTSEELYMRIPDCTSEGTYTVKVAIEYDEGYESDSAETSIKVSKGDCPVAQPQQQNQQQQTAQPRTIISAGIETQDVEAGNGAIFPITISNSGNAKVYSITLDGISDWASARVNPSNVISVGAGETKTVYVYLLAKDTASTGLHKVTANIKSDSETSQVLLNANVVKPTSSAQGLVNLKKGLEIGLVVLIVLLVIIALVIGFRKMNKDNNEGEGQKYY
ncbi:MAG TPA: hypothetical protein VI894_01050 [Candidatus Nanoarchaeia archaeon]|nr:hypothetical protein [Candidatus Nanoarchaeia archaeon]